MADSMAWVKSEYASEVAVLSAWLAALVPWSVTYQPAAQPIGGTIYMIRFPFFEVQVRALSILVNDTLRDASHLLAEFYPGTNLFEGVYVTTPPTAAAFYTDLPVTEGTVAAGSAPHVGSLAWTVGAAVLLVALALSLALYVDEAGTADRLPVDAVRAMGGLLAVATVALAVATVFYYQGRAVTGIPVPIGVVVVGALAGVLLRVERV